MLLDSQTNNVLGATEFHGVRNMTAAHLTGHIVVGLWCWCKPHVYYEFGSYWVCHYPADGADLLSDIQEDRKNVSQGH